MFNLNFFKMVIYNCVKTDKRANEILINYKDFYLSKEYKLIKSNYNVRCECGYTSCINLYDEKYKLYAFVVYCDSCGNDEAFLDEVLNLC